MIPFESDNVKAYTLLLRIEIVLRELSRISLEKEFGTDWRKRLPGDLLKKIKDSQKEESRPQFGYIRLGPLYYLTFGELLTLLQQKSGRIVAQKLGGDTILKQLENIFVPRNAVCHSRPVSAVGLKTIETLYAQIETALTPDELTRLISKPDTGLAQCEAARILIPALQSVLKELPSLPASFLIPETIKLALAQFWWADDALAGFSRGTVEAAVSCLQDYNKLPSGVGCAGTRLDFVERFQIEKVVQAAIAELEKVTNEFPF